jgi:predicted nicotinamide N-methyase
MEFVEEVVAVGPLRLRILRPPNPDDLIDEARFGDDEFMPYWAELWQSGVRLAEVVAARDLRGARVVELGCGLGVPSVAAALVGGQVLATDWAEDALAATSRNGELNGVALETQLVDWASPEALVARAPFDLVLCSDVLYEPRNVDALLALLPQLGDEVLLAEPGREGAGRFFVAAEEHWAIGREGEVTVLRRAS